jgi:hypothetical protein
VLAFIYVREDRIFEVLGIWAGGNSLTAAVRDRTTSLAGENRSVPHSYLPLRNGAGLAILSRGCQPVPFVP